jgi:hypothetical protein
MKQFAKSIGAELQLLQMRSAIQSIESHGLVEAAALRAAEAARRYTSASGTNKIELDLFTLCVALISFMLITIGIVGVLLVFVPGNSPT